MGVRAWLAGMRGDFAAETEKWDQQVEHVPPPNANADLPFIADVLEKQLGRAREAVKALDDKAALIIPAVGIIAGVVGTKVRTDIVDQQLLLLLGLVAGLSGVVTIILAILALYPRSFDNGPNALLVVWGTTEDKTTAMLNYIKAIGFSVRSAEALNQQKAQFVNWSLRVGAVGVLSLTGFVILGGFQQQ